MERYVYICSIVAVLIITLSQCHIDASTQNLNDVETIVVYISELLFLFSAMHVNSKA